MTSFVNLFCIKRCKDTHSLSNSQLYDEKIIYSMFFLLFWYKNIYHLANLL